ncbi:MAG TPA: tetratricopeptide repeat protein [Acidobacteriota bacterium]|jgi:tetratricopeptide (TPR) repeat protein
MKFPPVFRAALIALLFLIIPARGSAPAIDPQVRKAADLLQAGKIDEAERELSALLRASPRNAQALNLLGIVRGEQSRFEEAEKFFRRALQADPRLAGAAVNLGYLYRRTQRSEDALSAFARADRIQPNDPEIMFNLALLRAEAGEHAAALGLLDRIPKRNRPPGFAPLLARSYLALGREEDLKRSIPELRELVTPYPELIGELSQLLLNAQLGEIVIELLESIGGPARDSFALNFNLAEACEQKGDVAAAVARYQQALQAEPKSVEALKRLSLIAQRKGNWEEMFQYLARARELAPNSALMLYGLALAALRTGRIGESQRAIYQALELEPNSPDYLFLLSITQMSVSDIPAAVETFSRYVSFRPQDARGHLGLAAALYLSARYDEALQRLGKARQLDPSLTDTLYYLGMIALNRGDAEKALEYLNQVVAAEPNHAAARAGLGAVYLKKGDYGRAKEELETAVRLSPQHAPTHYQLSQALVRLNQTEAAERELKLYQELKTKEDEARTAASRLLPEKKN